MNLDGQAFGAPVIDTGATTINSSSAYAQLGGGPILLGGVKHGGLLELICGAGGAIAHLKITRAATIGGDHIDWLVDTDLNTATDQLLDCIVPGSSPPNIYQLATSGKGQLKFGNLNGVAEIGIWAKKATADTTLQATGAFF